MKTRRARLAAIVALGCIARIALAAELSPPMKVLGIEIAETGLLYMRLSANTQCGSPYVVLSGANASGGLAYDLAKLALATGQEVRVSVTSCDFQRRGVVERMVVGTP